MNDATKSAPPKLGNVQIQRAGGSEWCVQRDGVPVVSGLSFAQVQAIIRGELAIDAQLKPSIRIEGLTAIIRGELAIDALQGRQKGND